MGDLIKNGDHIRVTIEGPAFGCGSGEELARLFHSDGLVSIANKDTVTVEKIEPPVTVFKPGDVVQDKTNPRWKYAIGKKGYTQLSDGSYFEDGERFIQNEFTSKGYELVSLG